MALLLLVAEANTKILIEQSAACKNESLKNSIV